MLIQVDVVKLLVQEACLHLSVVVYRDFILVRVISVRRTSISIQRTQTIFDDVRFLSRGLMFFGVARSLQLQIFEYVCQWLLFAIVDIAHVMGYAILLLVFTGFGLIVYSCLRLHLSLAVVFDWFLLLLPLLCCFMWAVSVSGPLKFSCLLDRLLWLARSDWTLEWGYALLIRDQMLLVDERVPWFGCLGRSNFALRIDFSWITFHL